MPLFDASAALSRGTDVLLSHQGNVPRADFDGAPCWEGEVVWCPMLAAQYVLAEHIMEQPISKVRRERLLRHFEDTQLPSGCWGLSPHAPDSLFVTTLVYVAARMIGEAADSAFLRRARLFIAGEGGAGSIPSWGKAWLALANLYDWDGLHAVAPEVWLLPKAMPLHPSNYYCHTRLIYLGMAALYGRRLQARRTALIDELRDELYPGQVYGEIDWKALRGALRPGDLWAPPGRRLKGLYALTDAAQPALPETLRRRTIEKLQQKMRWELRSSDHTCISPVNGLLFMLSLWSTNPDDPDVARQRERFEGWIWEDDEQGFRVTGARSATWDTSFALQALAAVADADGPEGVRNGLLDGLRWLETQQMKSAKAGFEEQDRIDSRGGFCFAGVWHGWPVSDCTAEAMCAFLEAPESLYQADPDAMAHAARFVLRCQNPDGGFGSYEAQKTPVSLEWMNPAEMFADSMTELSYTECTASCVVALMAFCHRYPGHELVDEIHRRVRRATARLRSSQNENGSWQGVWGVAHLYGTLFGVRGLLAAGPEFGGASSDDICIRRACVFVKSKQRGDGSWGEHPNSCLEDRYLELGHGHAVQTAWALLTLLDADEPELSVISRGAEALSMMAGADGDWPEQEMVGVFFRTALLDYRLYRRFFPVWALARYEERRRRESKVAPWVEPVLEQFTAAALAAGNVEARTR